MLKLNLLRLCADTDSNRDRLAYTCYSKTKCTSGTLISPSVVSPINGMPEEEPRDNEHIQERQQSSNSNNYEKLDNNQSNVSEIKINGNLNFNIA